MKNKRAYKMIAFSLLLTMFPLRVSAAETVKNEVRIIADSKAGIQKQAETAFSETIQKHGKIYGLTDIEYTDYQTRYLDKKEKVVESEEKPEDTRVENGEVYTLQSVSEREEVVTERREQMVTAYEEYDETGNAASTKTVTVVNESTGRQEQVVCSLRGVYPLGSTVEQNQMSVVFSDYDAMYYEWNGNDILGNEKTPPLAGYESQLLASVGADAGSQITGYYWNGEAYMVDGVVYRDAVATVQQQKPRYRAEYTGKIVTPEKREKVYTAIYETPDKDGDKEVTVSAVAVYTEQAERSIVPYVIAAGVGLVLLAGLLALILALLAKKKKEKSYT